MKKTFVILFVVVFSIFRIILAARSSQFGPDEAIFVLKTYQFFHCDSHPELMVENRLIQGVFRENLTPCHVPFITGMPGHLGVRYGPYPSYWIGTLLLIFQYQLVIIATFTTILNLLGVYLIFRSLTNESNQLKTWITLLALTSPLAISFSLAPFWDTPWLMVLSSLIIYISLRTISSPKKELVLGILTGVAFASHLQSMPFLFGFTLWYFLIYQRHMTTVKYYMGGFFVSAGVYISYLLFGGSFLHFRPWIAGSIPQPRDGMALITGIYRFFGLSMEHIVHKMGIFSSVEGRLAWVTSVLLLFLVFLTFYVLTKKRQALLSHRLFPLFLLIYPFYVGIVFISHSESFIHEQMMMWWVAPYGIAVVLFSSIPKRIAPYLCGFLVFFNVCVLSTQYSSRFIQGSGIGFPHGPSIQMQQLLSKQICELVERSSLPRVKIGIDHKISDGSALSLSLPALITLQSGGCASRVVFVEETTPYDLQIKAQEGSVVLEVGSN